MRAILEWYGDFPAAVRYGIALTVLAANALIYLFGYIWVWGWGLGIALLIFAGASSSEKNGYRDY